MLGGFHSTTVARSSFPFIPCILTRHPAFNAALVIFSCWLIKTKYEPPRVSESISTELCSLTFQNAIDALQVLDTGNAIAEKCVEYLKQLRYIMSSFGGKCLTTLLSPLNLTMAIWREKYGQFRVADLFHSGFNSPWSRDGTRFSSIYSLWPS